MRYFLTSLIIAHALLLSTGQNLYTLDLCTLAAEGDQVTSPPATSEAPAQKEDRSSDALPRAALSDKASLADKAIPPAKPTYMGRRIAPTMSFAHAAWLTRPERQQEEDPLQAIGQLGLKSGMVVCDMGCGNGFYSLEMAKRILPGGRVIAVDIQQEMLHLLHLRAQEANIDNIQTVLGTLVDPFLPEGELDLVLMVDVYHEFSHPEQMLQAIRKSLKPTGRIALVEFRAEDPRVPILPLHKMSKRQILREFRANGFRLVEEYDELPWQHLMFFGLEDN
jgi:ubiquinone/menaquinone biosynthesis C-methylase UbiE